ncbi:MAG: hypothetical protein MZV70_68315 [Desulfobacterales bacterium]|nr:hypothetical protein [Desulfobacterales bacterium]
MTYNKEDLLNPWHVVTRKHGIAQKSTSREPEHLTHCDPCSLLHPVLKPMTTQTLHIPIQRHDLRQLRGDGRAGREKACRR